MNALKQAGHVAGLIAAHAMGLAIMAVLYLLLAGLVALVTLSFGLVITCIIAEVLLLVAFIEWIVGSYRDSARQRKAQ